MLKANDYLAQNYLLDILHKIFSKFQQQMSEIRFYDKHPDEYKVMLQRIREIIGRFRIDVATITSAIKNWPNPDGRLVSYRLEQLVDIDNFDFKDVKARLNLFRQIGFDKNLFDEYLIIRKQSFFDGIDNGYLRVVDVFLRNDI
jgi:hypothetical protein